METRTSSSLQRVDIRKIPPSRQQHQTSSRRNLNNKQKRRIHRREEASVESFSTADFTGSSEIIEDTACVMGPERLRHHSGCSPLHHHKVVQFGECKIYEVENQKKINNNRNKKKIWYSNRELNNINRKNCNIVKKADAKGICSYYFDDFLRNSNINNNRNNNIQQTIRGLEKSLPHDVQAKKRHYFQDVSRKAVLDEQLRQRTLGISDPNRIQEIYETNGANTCQQIASKFGLYDECIATKLQDQQTKEEEENENNNNTTRTRKSSSSSWYKIIYPSNHIQY